MSIASSVEKKLRKQTLPDTIIGCDDSNGTKSHRVHVPSTKLVVTSPDVTFMDFKAKTGCTSDVKQLNRNITLRN